jgi:hypothetical protein
VRAAPADLHLRDGAACGQCRAPHVHVCHRDGNPNRAVAKTKHPWRVENGMVTGGLIKRASPAMIHACFEYVTTEYPAEAGHGMGHGLVVQHLPAGSEQEEFLEACHRERGDVLQDRPVPREREADRGAGCRRFRQRRLDDAFGSEFSDEAGPGAERRSLHGLADQECPRVSCHLEPGRFSDGLDDVDSGHGFRSDSDRR